MTPFHKKEILVEKLKHWFLDNKRNFPWRDNPTPYAVWVSEVMLQQTVASVVVPYFHRWMDRFPTIEALANAPLEMVIKTWEGLGYYARARNLHTASQYIVAHHKGQVPADPEALAKIKGLGPYTIGAILSFAFHMKAAAVDGNVLRVMSRLLCHEEDIDRPSVQAFIRKKVDELLPDIDSWIIMEGLIELGALVCTKSPKCELCPLQDECAAYLTGNATVLPKRQKRVETTLLKREVAIIGTQNEILVQHHTGKKVMSGLYEFPYFDTLDQLKIFYPAPLTFYKKLKTVFHTFTKYKAQLHPTLWVASAKYPVDGYEWIEKHQLQTLPFSSGHRKLLKEVEHASFTH